MWFNCSCNVDWWTSVIVYSKVAGDMSTLCSESDSYSSQYYHNIYSTSVHIYLVVFNQNGNELFLEQLSSFQHFSEMTLFWVMKEKEDEQGCWCYSDAWLGLGKWLIQLYIHFSSRTIKLQQHQIGQASGMTPWQLQNGLHFCGFQLSECAACIYIQLDRQYALILHKSNKWWSGILYMNGWFWIKKLRYGFVWKLYEVHGSAYGLHTAVKVLMWLMDNIFPSNLWSLCLWCTKFGWVFLHSFHWSAPRNR